MATRLRTQVNPFLLSCHCVAHRTNLAALDAAKSPTCKVISPEIDILINNILSFFHKSDKRKHALTALQERFYDSKKSMKRYHKIRWLSRWQSVTALCNSLKSVQFFYKESDDKDAATVLDKIGQFKYVYILYFLTDILHSLAMLSKVFQLKFVDVITIGSIVRTKVAQIRLLFIIDTCDLNADVFNESTGFHVLPDYGPDDGYLRRLQSKLRGSMFHEFLGQLLGSNFHHLWIQQLASESSLLSNCNAPRSGVTKISETCGA